MLTPAGLKEIATYADGIGPSRRLLASHLSPPATEPGVATAVAATPSLAGTPNGAAYLPPAAAEDEASVPMTDLGTTAYATVLPDSNTGPGREYEAQPPRSPLFNAASVPVAGFLSFLSMTAARLPTLQESLNSPPLG